MEAKIKPMTREVLGADSKPLNVVGETTLRFSCECCTHKGRRMVPKLCFIFNNMNTDLLIPYSLTTDLGLIRRTCSSSIVNNTETEAKEEY